MLWSDIIQRTPIVKEIFRRPMAYGFDDVRWRTGNEELGGTANAETMACHMWVSKRLPDGVALL